MSQLPADCLYEILKYLENDKFTLNSCILVNRFWCEVSVRIFWRNVWNYNTLNFRTLIACLSNKSKEILCENGIIISTPTSKFPTYNYASFCKVLSVEQVYNKINLLLKRTISSKDSNNIKHMLPIVVQEIFKLFIKHVSSLKKLEILSFCQWQSPPTHFIFYPGAKDFFKNLSELHCSSNISSEFFYQLSQTCYNIESFTIEARKIVSNGLVDLISVQKNIKYFDIMLGYGLTKNELINTIPSLMAKLSNTLIKLKLYGNHHHYTSLSFIANLVNLQELVLYFCRDGCFGDFGKLQYINFQKLQILKIQDRFPKVEVLIKFLENNGKYLKEFYIGDDDGKSDNSLNLSIAKFCPMLRKLSTGIKSNELETLKIIFDNCKYLESIKIWCGDEFLSEKQALETVVKYSQNINEIILYHLFTVRFKLLPKTLESFFVNWTNRTPQKSFSLVIVTYDGENSLDKNDENMEIIQKYINLGVIKNFKVTDFDDKEYN
ncbi:unnamed protein product [Rhizophagus irregularis]|nr:unnamed protein product [Rhizophagus irregularis]